MIGSCRPELPYPCPMANASAQRPPILTQVVAPVVIAIIVAIILLAAIHTSINESANLRSLEHSSTWTGPNEEFQCLRAAFQRAVPRGSSVWVGNPESKDPSSGGTGQMVAEMATLWAIPASESSAQWAATLAFGPECKGLTVHAEKLR
jgi:hypothetical protein